MHGVRIARGLTAAENGTRNAPGLYLESTKGPNAPGLHPDCTWNELLIDGAKVPLSSLLTYLCFPWMSSMDVCWKCILCHTFLSALVHWFSGLAVRSKPAGEDTAFIPGILSRHSYKDA